jgi:hypothetical protein
LSLKDYQQKIKQYNLEDEVSDEETTFAEDDDAPEYITLKYSQRLESCWCLLWALNLVKDLSRPDNFCNAERVTEIIETRSTEQLIVDAKLRSKDEILDAADLHFRYHWSVVDAELYGKKPPRGMLASVIYERHYALNWLIQYKDQDWDDVTTDT